MKILHIPTRERLKGQTIICNRCKSKGYCSTKTATGKTKWICKNTGKLLRSCPNPESHRYISTLYNPFTQKSDIVIRHETRDFWEFRRRHNELLNVEQEIKMLYRSGNIEMSRALIASFKSPKETGAKVQEIRLNSREIIITETTSLEEAMYIYADFLDGKKGEDWEKRPKTKSTITTYKRALERFHECLTKNGYQPELIPLQSINKKHLHIWVKEVKSRYKGNKTQNHYLNNVNTFLKWCSKRGAGDICNALEYVKRGKTVGDTTIATLEEFKTLIAAISKEKSREVYTWEDQKTKELKKKSRNHYYPWLKDGLWLSLLLGGRGDDITHFKWSDIKEKKIDNVKSHYWIELLDYKYLRQHEVAKYNYIPMYRQTYDILIELGLKQNINSNTYVLAPNYTNRERMKEVMSKSFHWYWRVVAKLNPEVKYKSLRSTFITIASMSATGDKWQLIQKHTNMDTTRKHYFEKSHAVSEMFGETFGA